MNSSKQYAHIDNKESELLFENPDGSDRESETFEHESPTFEFETPFSLDIRETLYEHDQRMERSIGFVSGVGMV
jgi:hypothetical protein